MIYYVSVGEKSTKASGKARLDIERVFQKLGYMEYKEKKDDFKGEMLISIPKVKKFFEDLRRWTEIVQGIKFGDVLIIQHPMTSSLIVYKSIRKIKKNGVKVVIIVHDIFSIRDKQNLRNPYYRIRDFELLKLCDAVISHNCHMTDILVSRGVDKKKIVDLELFDYIYPKSINREFGKDERHSIVVAGNLDKYKASYIYKLGEKLENSILYLYGRNYDSSYVKNDRTVYKGELLSDELPEKMQSGFGLVWDGSSLNCCDGNTGEYLKINNPHKTSCNIAAGLPLIVWSKSAVADVVRKYGIGICVESLQDIDSVIENIGISDFNYMLENVKWLSEKVRSGYFTETAIKKALEIIKDDCNNDCRIKIKTREAMK